MERSNVQALANAILQLLSNPKQRDAMAQAAYERASTMFSWDCIAEDLLKSSLTKYLSTNEHLIHNASATGVSISHDYASAVVTFVDSGARCNGSMRTGFARLCQAL